MNKNGRAAVGSEATLMAVSELQDLVRILHQLQDEGQKKGDTVLSSEKIYLVLKTLKEGNESQKSSAVKVIQELVKLTKYAYREIFIPELLAAIPYQNQVNRGYLISATDQVLKELKQKELAGIPVDRERLDVYISDLIAELRKEDGDKKDISLYLFLIFVGKHGLASLFPAKQAIKKIIRQGNISQRVLNQMCVVAIKLLSNPNLETKELLAVIDMLCELGVSSPVVEHALKQKAVFVNLINSVERVKKVAIKNKVLQLIFQWQSSHNDLRINYSAIEHLMALLSEKDGNLVTTVANVLIKLIGEGAELPDVSVFLPENLLAAPVSKGTKQIILNIFARLIQKKNNLLRITDKDISQLLVIINEEDDGLVCSVVDAMQGLVKSGSPTRWLQFLDPLMRFITSGRHYFIYIRSAIDSLTDLAADEAVGRKIVAKEGFLDSLLGLLLKSTPDIQVAILRLLDRPVFSGVLNNELAQRKELEDMIHVLLVLPGLSEDKQIIIKSLAKISLSEGTQDASSDLSWGGYAPLDAFSEFKIQMNSGCCLFGSYDDYLFPNGDFPEKKEVLKLLNKYMMMHLSQALVIIREGKISIPVASEAGDDESWFQDYLFYNETHMLPKGLRNLLSLTTNELIFSSFQQSLINYVDDASSDRCLKSILGFVHFLLLLTKLVNERKSVPNDIFKGLGVWVQHLERSRIGLLALAFSILYSVISALGPVIDSVMLSLSKEYADGSGLYLQLTAAKKEFETLLRQVYILLKEMVPALEGIDFSSENYSEIDRICSESFEESKKKRAAGNKKKKKKGKKSGSANGQAGGGAEKPDSDHEAVGTTSVPAVRGPVDKIKEVDNSYFDFDRDVAGAVPAGEDAARVDVIGTSSVENDAAKPDSEHGAEVAAGLTVVEDMVSKQPAGKPRKISEVDKHRLLAILTWGSGDMQLKVIEAIARDVKKFGAGRFISIFPQLIDAIAVQNTISRKPLVGLICYFMQAGVDDRLLTEERVKILIDLLLSQSEMASDARICIFSLLIGKINFSEAQRGLGAIVSYVITHGFSENPQETLFIPYAVCRMFDTYGKDILSVMNNKPNMEIFIGRLTKFYNSAFEGCSSDIAQSTRCQIMDCISLLLKTLLEDKEFDKSRLLTIDLVGLFVRDLPLLDPQKPLLDIVLYIMYCGTLSNVMAVSKLNDNNLFMHLLKFAKCGPKNIQIKALGIIGNWLAQLEITAWSHRKRMVDVLIGLLAHDGSVQEESLQILWKFVQFFDERVSVENMDPLLKLLSCENSSIKDPVVEIVSKLVEQKDNALLCSQRDIDNLFLIFCEEGNKYHVILALLTATYALTRFQNPRGFLKFLPKLLDYIGGDNPDLSDVSLDVVHNIIQSSDDEVLQLLPEGDIFVDRLVQLLSMDNPPRTQVAILCILHRLIPEDQLKARLPGKIGPWLQLLLAMPLPPEMRSGLIALAEKLVVSTSNDPSKMNWRRFNSPGSWNAYMFQMRYRTFNVVGYSGYLLPDGGFSDSKPALSALMRYMMTDLSDALFHLRSRGVVFSPKLYFLISCLRSDIQFSGCHLGFGDQMALEAAGGPSGTEFFLSSEEKRKHYFDCILGYVHFLHLLSDLAKDSSLVSSKFLKELSSGVLHPCNGELTLLALSFSIVRAVLEFVREGIKNCGTKSAAKAIKDQLLAVEKQFSPLVTLLYEKSRKRVPDLPVFEFGKCDLAEVEKCLFEALQHQQPVKSAAKRKKKKNKNKNKNKKSNANTGGGAAVKATTTYRSAAEAAAELAAQEVAEAKRKADEEAAAQLAAEAAETKRKAEEEAAAQLAAQEAAEAKRKADEETARQAAQEAAEAKRKADEEAAPQAAQEAAEAKRKAEEEAAAQLAAQEAAATKRKAEEEAAAQLAAQEAAEAKRKAEADAAAQLAAQEAAEAKRKAEEDAQRKSDEEVVRQAAEAAEAQTRGLKALLGITAPPVIAEATADQDQSGGGGAAPSAGKDLSMQTDNGYKYPMKRSWDSLTIYNASGKGSRLLTFKKNRWLYRLLVALITACRRSEVTVYLEGSSAHNPYVKIGELDLGICPAKEMDWDTFKNIVQSCWDEACLTVFSSEVHNQAFQKIQPGINQGIYIPVKDVAVMINFRLFLRYSICLTTNYSSVIAEMGVSANGGLMLSEPFYFGDEAFTATPCFYQDFKKPDANDLMGLLKFLHVLNVMAKLSIRFEECPNLMIVCMNHLLGSDSPVPLLCNFSLSLCRKYFRFSSFIGILNEYINSAPQDSKISCFSTIFLYLIESCNRFPELNGRATYLGDKVVAILSIFRVRSIMDNAPGRFPQPPSAAESAAASSPAGPPAT